MRILTFELQGKGVFLKITVRHEPLPQERLQEYSSDYSFLSRAAAKREANVCQTFSKYSR